jgi:hypothetical protein
LKMTKEEFQQFWAANYPETLPINYLFKHNLKSRWLRIHSLPESKRYAENDEDWRILLERQNTIIDDLIGQNSVVNVVVNFIEIDSFLFKMFDFTNIGVFADNESETVFQSFIFEIVWETNHLNPMLREIANDKLRAFMIGKDCLIAPYDGGVDITFKDSATRDFYKLKYKNWLSTREDGL